MTGYLHTVLWYGLIAISSVLAIAYAYFTHLYGYFRRRGYPYEPATFPFGNLLPVFTLRKSYSSILADLYDKYKGEEFVGFFQFGKKSVLIVDRDLVKNVLAKDFNHFDQKSIHYEKDREPLTAHLFALGGDEWRELRKKLVPAYTSGKLKGMSGTVSDVGRELNKYVVKKCEENDVLECKDLFLRYGLSMIASTAFGLDTDVFKDSTPSSFLQNANAILPPTLGGLLRMSAMFYGREVAQALKILIIPKDCHEFFFNLVKITLEHREATGTARNDFLQLMIQMKEGMHKEPGLTLNEIAAQSFVFILAGFETVSNTMSFFLYEMAMNPQIQQKVLADVDSVDDVTYQSLASMEYLEMAIDGLRFGRLVVKAGLATLLREYTVERCDRTPLPLRYDVKSISTTAEGGIWLRFVPRNMTWNTS